MLFTLQHGLFWKSFCRSSYKVTIFLLLGPLANMHWYILINTNPLYKVYFALCMDEINWNGSSGNYNVVTVLSLVVVDTFSKESCFVAIRMSRRGSLSETRRSWKFGRTPFFQRFSLVTAMECARKRQLPCTIQFVCKHNCRYETTYLKKEQSIDSIYFDAALSKRWDILFCWSVCRSV